MWREQAPASHVTGLAALLTHVLPAPPPRPRPNTAQVPKSMRLFGSGEPDAPGTRWLIPYRELKLQKPIGEGAFGKVYLAQWQECDVAVKLLTSLQPLGVGESVALWAGAGGEPMPGCWPRCRGCCCC